MLICWNTRGRTKAVLRDQSIPGLELFSTERVCDVFNRVTQTVSVIVSGIDAPAEEMESACNILLKEKFTF